MFGSFFTELDWQNTWTALEAFFKNPFVIGLLFLVTFILGSVCHGAYLEWEYQRYMRTCCSSDEGEE